MTNVVRHSGAQRCVVALTPRQTLDGPVLELMVQDNGRGGSAPFGNGLTGLSERITDVGGTVDTGSGRGSQGGFTLTVRVPLGSAS